MTATTISLVQTKLPQVRTFKEIAKEIDLEDSTVSLLQLVSKQLEELQKLQICIFSEQSDLNDPCLITSIQNTKSGISKTTEFINQVNQMKKGGAKCIYSLFLGNNLSVTAPNDTEILTINSVIKTLNSKLKIIEGKLTSHKERLQNLSPPTRVQNETLEKHKNCNYALLALVIAITAMTAVYFYIPPKI